MQTQIHSSMTLHGMAGKQRSLSAGMMSENKCGGNSRHVGFKSSHKSLYSTHPRNSAPGGGTLSLCN
ncbi:hypothetical protein PBY51_013568 [Eleginops maclovinus]|uniref:Uncharacterized protein n=1 Tax=Eleginops maclovinus TaxID=56733 RepID=A0AAN7Y635_ELEMC|nr:hypothetical protein PBY51_013568 [Eleginops maclovinus]